MAINWGQSWKVFTISNANCKIFKWGVMMSKMVVSWGPRLGSGRGDVPYKDERKAPGVALANGSPMIKSIEFFISFRKSECNSVCLNVNTFLLVLFGCWVTTSELKWRLIWLMIDLFDCWSSLVTKPFMAVQLILYGWSYIFSTRQGGHGEFMQLIHIFYLEGKYIIGS